MHSEETENKRGKNPNSLKNLAPPFQKGAKPGPGRPKGVRSARDIYCHIGTLTAPKAIIETLKQKGITVTSKELDDVIAYTTALQAAAGNAAARREYNDRRFGKSEQTINTNINDTHSLVFEVVEDKEK